MNESTAPSGVHVTHMGDYNSISNFVGQHLKKLSDGMQLWFSLQGNNSLTNTKMLVSYREIFDDMKVTLDLFKFEKKEIKINIS